MNRRSKRYLRIIFSYCERRVESTVYSKYKSCTRNGHLPTKPYRSRKTALRTPSAIPANTFLAVYIQRRREPPQTIVEGSEREKPNGKKREHRRRRKEDGRRKSPKFATTILVPVHRPQHTNTKARKKKKTL